jgi:DNA-binding NtrC family response regulator
VPALRDRPGDIALLADGFLTAARVRGARARELSRDAAIALVRHPWPGNVRELRNVIERAAALARGPTIELDDLRLEAPRRAPSGSSPPVSLAEQFAALADTERTLVRTAMDRAGGNLAEAARLLGITRIMMKRRVDRLEDDER